MSIRKGSNVIAGKGASFPAQTGQNGKFLQNENNIQEKPLIHVHNAAFEHCTKLYRYTYPQAEIPQVKFRAFSLHTEHQ